jgi:HAE1 family hydrophobic/amphiphilic exporter-1
VFLSDVSIRRPVFTLMMSLALLVFGFIAYRSLPVDQFPPVDFPIMLVQTVWPGAAPEDVERDVSRKVEDAVASVPGLEKLQSISRDSVSLVVLQFEIGTDLTDTSSTVRDRVGAIQQDLPDGADAPVIRRIELGALPVMVVAVSAPGGVDAARSLAEDRLRARLEQVPGVGAVNVVGGREREIRVDLDLDALAALGLPPGQIAERLGVENLSLPVGTLQEHGYAIGIRADGRYRSVADLASTVVWMTREGRQVRLSEVARVYDDHAIPDQMVRFNGREAVSLEVVKRSGANTVEVAHGVHAALDELQATLPLGAKSEVIWDQSVSIEANAEEVTTAIWFGGAMAVLVILFFLLDLRGTLISALALPTSVVGTFAMMGALGFSLNTMTLLGLSLAIGLLIDDAVVVREAITHRLELGDTPEQAASRGTAEIALAVLATTLSLVAVFVPVAFMSGIVGQFFKQFGLTIAVAVLLSLFVAFTLDPMLSARLSTVRHGPRRGVARVVERILEGIDEIYRRVLAWVLQWRFTTMAIAGLILLCSGGLAALLPAEFVPQEDRGDFFADVRLPVGSSLDATAAAVQSVEPQLLSIPGVERVYAVVGVEDADNRVKIRVGVKPREERDEPLEAFMDATRAILETLPSAEVTISRPSPIEGLGGDFSPLMIIVQGDDLTQLRAEADRIRATLEAIPGTSDVRLSVSLGRPELHVAIDRDVAADRGVPAGLVGATARMLVEGQVVGSLQDGEDEADIRMRADPRFAVDQRAIAALPLPSPRGRVALGDVARVEMAAGAAEVQRQDRMRAITVSSQIAPGGSLGAILDGLEAELTARPLPEGMYWVLDGEAKNMAETADSMGFAMAVAMICIFMVLASQFESLAHPFTLLLSVPLGLIGSVWALAVTGSSISMGSQIGLILLMGLVTKNAILLVDGALQAQRDGADPVEAMRRAGPRRLRPILMTSAAMVLGMVPTAIGTGVGAEFRAPMAISVIGGVISSTFLTLLVVPVAFVWMEWWIARGGALWARWVRRTTEEVSAAPAK